jgi:hypothetical protein
MKREKQLPLILAVVGVGILVGCETRVPLVQHHEGTYQIKVQALEHWDLMAKEVAAKTTSFPGFATRAIQVDTNTVSTPYVYRDEGLGRAHEDTRNTFFTEAFTDMIRSELANSSMKLVESTNTPLTLSVRVHLARHGKRFSSNPTTIFGAIGYHVDSVFSGQEVGSPDNCKYEVLVVTQVREGERVMMAVKQIVYVSADEGYLYFNPIYRKLDMTPVKVTVSK